MPNIAPLGNHGLPGKKKRNPPPVWKPPPPLRTTPTPRVNRSPPPLPRPLHGAPPTPHPVPQMWTKNTTHGAKELMD